MRVFAPSAIVTFLALLVQCSSPIPFGNDTRSFVVDGMSEVRVASVVFRVGSSVRDPLPSGVPVTVVIKLINPQRFDVSYSLTVSGDGAQFSDPPAPAPSSSDPEQLTFEFTLDSAAEHKDLSFSLGMFVPSTSKTFEPAEFQARCDSPPHSVGNLTADLDSDRRAFVAFTLPETVSDDDLASLVVTYQQVQNVGSPGPVVSQTFDVDAAALDAAPSPDPLASQTGTKRYFRPSVPAGYAYAFQVTVVDAAGQSSPTQTGGAEGLTATVTYDANGGSGSVLASHTYNYGTTVVLSSGVTLSRTGFIFAGWNTEADGSGDDYAASSSFVTGETDLYLYAHWVSIADIDVTVEWAGAFQPLAVSPSSTTISLGDAITISAAFAGGSGWMWYLDGALESMASTYTVGPSAAGTYFISVTVVKDGVLYSGNMILIVTIGDPMS